MPIEHYLAMDLQPIGILNDAIGGVTVTALEDMKLWMINYDFVYKNLQDVQDYWYQFR